MAPETRITCCSIGRTEPSASTGANARRRSWLRAYAGGHVDRILDRAGDHITLSARLGSNNGWRTADHGRAARDRRALRRPGLTERLVRAAAAAPAAGVLVIYVKVGVRKGHPEISPRNRLFAAIAETGGVVEGLSRELHPALAPQLGDVVFTKRRVSAFASSDLGVVLRAAQYESASISPQSLPAAACSRRCAKRQISTSHSRRRLHRRRRGGPQSGHAERASGRSAPAIPIATTTLPCPVRAFRRRCPSPSPSLSPGHDGGASRLRAPMAVGDTHPTPRSRPGAGRAAVPSCSCRRFLARPPRRSG